MRVFFDNCTSPVLPACLDAFVRLGGHSAHHIGDLPCGRDATDVDWIRMLQDDPDDWIVVTGDLRISRNHPERAAYRAAGLFGIVLSRGLLRLKVNEQAALILWRWPVIYHQYRVVSRPALYELPAGRGSKLRSLPL